jgi:outer membrane protein assembly factor BamD (BamD/ComL family)
MKRPLIRLCVPVVLLAVLAIPASAQRSTTRKPKNQKDNQQQPEKPAKLTRAQKAHRMYSAATSLWQGKRRIEAAEMYEAMIKAYPTSERVPEAMARAISLYYGSQEPKAQTLINIMTKKFPNNQHAVTAYWQPVAVKCSRDSKEPLDLQIALLEKYLDRYWAQAHFSEAVEYLARALLRSGKIKELDAFLTHVLAETGPEGTGHMINMIQRSCGRRKDHINMAKVYGGAAKNIDAKEPAVMPLRMLEIGYLLAAGRIADKDKAKESDESKKARADALDMALKRAEKIVFERPKSEYAAFCALQLKPSILSLQEKSAEAANALRSALQSFSLFALKGHKEKLAEYEVAAGNFREAAKVMAELLSGTNWPAKQYAYLGLRHGHLYRAKDIDGANTVNSQIAEAFPRTRAAIGAELRTFGNLVVATRFDEAKAKLRSLMDAYKNDAAVAAMIFPQLGRFPGEVHAADTKAIREQFIGLFPASAAADEVRKLLKMPIASSPTAQAKALFAEYQGFAKESNVDAARRRIDRLFKEFPSSDEGRKAAYELADALAKAGKPEMAAELNLLASEHCPLATYTEERLRSAAAAFNGAAKPEEAMKAYRKLVSAFRYSTYWERYVRGAAGTLDSQSKTGEAERLVNAAAKPLGNGPEATSLRAYMARRLEGQDDWKGAADKMLDVLGSNASNPAYRSLIAQAFRFLVVAGSGDATYKKKEQKLLADLAAKYEGWDEADHIRLSLCGSYARDKQAAKAIKMLKGIQKKHTKYDLGAHGEPMVRHLSKYGRGLFQGTVGYHPVSRVNAEMSGGWGNYLYAHTAEDMIDYVLMLNDPKAYLDRMRKELGRLIKTKPKRKRGYKSGLPYKTKNVLRPRWHPWPEQRRVYHMVSRIANGYRRLQQRMDSALWLQVYSLWPHYYMNDERVRAAAGALIGRGDRAGTQKAMSILQKEYNKSVWEPYILYAQANYLRNHGGSSKALQLFKTLATRYRDHEYAARAAQAYKDLGGR